MKKVLFALPLLALATLLSYCHKSAGPEIGSNLPTENLVSDRACNDQCDLHFEADNLQAIRVCGTIANALPCTSCSGVGSTGIQQFTGSGSFSVLACTSFTLFNSHSGITAVTFDGGGIFYQIPGNGCLEFIVDEDCKIHPI